MKTISVIIPCRNEEQYIAACLDSIIDSDYPKNFLEVIIVDGMSEDNTMPIIESYQKKYPFIRVISNEKRVVPVAMNLGIQNSSGDYIIRLDAHAIYPSHYFSKLIEWSIKLDADNVGAVCKTDVYQKNNISNSIKTVMSDKFGVGNSKFRTGAAEVTSVDTVPFGCYKKEVFEQYGLYNVNLVRTQDIEFNKRIVNGGGKIYLIPDLECTYFARDTYKSFFLNRFNTGKWAILATYLTKSFKSISMRHFIPMLFVLSLSLPLLFFPLLSVLSFFTYAIVILLRTVVIQHRTNTHTTILHIYIAFFLLHFSYGFGSLIGIALILFDKMKIKKFIRSLS